MLAVVSTASSSAFIHQSDMSRHRRITKLNNGGMDAYDAQMAAMLANTNELSINSQDSDDAADYELKILAKFSEVIY